MVEATAATAGGAGFDPVLLAVLSNRFESIIREMTNTVMKASRSSVIRNARDMSCGILTHDHRLVSVEEARPAHVDAHELTTRPITELFDDIADGDALLDNSPFHGGTHHADLTLCAPAFGDGEPLFWTLSRSHHADMGRPCPRPISLMPTRSTARACMSRACGSRRTAGTRPTSCGSASRRSGSATSGTATTGPRSAPAGPASGGSRSWSPLTARTRSRRSSRPGSTTDGGVRSRRSGRCRPAPSATRSATTRCRAYATTASRSGRWSRSTTSKG